MLLLSIAAVPGSIFPQRSIDAGRVADFLATNPGVGPWLDRLSFFDVYASPWFSAIYLLLVISLIGCIVPRSKLHWHALRSRPPRAPARLQRLPAHTSCPYAGSPEEALTAAAAALRRRRYRVHAHDAESVSAEIGYLRETGNLVFTSRSAWSSSALRSGICGGGAGTSSSPRGRPSCRPPAITTR